ncbi:LytTR family transcriptional regulator DNA-binding domain-containing protein [Bradyrhizobium sp.]|uniref:LytTR family transcriptional regulator DNA-binding domain-containing protein n=1 Tax=Bradyrhizobium sp. TaxID=376 RepID=UPI0039E64E03
MTRELIPTSEVFTRSECDGEISSRDWAHLAALFLLQQPIEDAIASILAALGEAAKSDRAWIFEYDSELLRFRNTHEWCRDGTEGFVQDLQYAPVTMIGWLHRHLVLRKAVMINDVGSLPRTARALQAEMLRQGDKSVLCVPVFHDGKLRACIGFDAVRAKRRWGVVVIRSLFQCADLIAAARYGARATDDPKAVAGFSAPVYLRKANGIRGVQLTMIVGLRSSGDYTEVWLSDGTMVLDNRPLVQWMGLTPRAEFLRVHRTAIVNLRQIRNVDRRASGAWQVSLQHVDNAWPVSRAGRAELRVRLGL